MNKTIYLDMDGVLCDFVGGAILAHGRMDLYKRYKAGTFPVTWHFEGALGYGSAFWGPIKEQGIGFWSNLEPFDDCGDILEMVDRSGCDWYLCTTPYGSVESYTGKAMWLANKYPEILDSGVITMTDKELLAKDNTLLIDDNTSNCAKFSNAGGCVYNWPTVWNGSIKCEIENRLDSLKDVIYDFSVGAVCT